MLKWGDGRVRRGNSKLEAQCCCGEELGEEEPRYPVEGLKAA